MTLASLNHSLASLQTCETWLCRTRNVLHLLTHTHTHMIFNLLMPYWDKGEEEKEEKTILEILEMMMKKKKNFQAPLEPYACSIIEVDMLY